MPKAFLLDVDYVKRPVISGDNELEQGVIRLVLRSNGKVLFRYVEFDPYFYYDGVFPKELEDVPQIKSIRKVARILGNVKKRIIKVVCYNPTDVPKLRSIFDKFGRCYEADIPFVKRFMIDSGVSVFSVINYTNENKDYVKISSCSSSDFKLNRLAFDIETYNPYGVPRPDKDPIIILSYATHNAKGFITYKKTDNRHAVVVDDERRLLSRFCKLIRDNNTDIIYTYNGSEFDFPYLRSRAKRLRTDFVLGRDNTALRLRKSGMYSTASISGRLHLDVYHMSRFLAMIGALRTNVYTLSEVYKEMFGSDKISVQKLDIWKMWESDSERDLLFRYALSDAQSTYELGERLLPIFVEISRIAHMRLEDSVSSTTGQLVEAVLLKSSHDKGIVAPNKPKETLVASRFSESIEGAYVKMPSPGIYNNIVVFDFRSLYPSIIVSHNISPETLNCACCSDNEAHISPDGHRFCAKKKGLISDVLSSLLKHRYSLKKLLKSLDKDSEEYRYAYARQYAFKIIANSFYGMLRYGRARWYCRECASATTAWERYYIKDVIAKAEKEGFNVLYSDTDSIFILLDGKSEDEAMHFMNKVNRSLPKGMELELEDVYTRGVFVAKKSGKAGAKKKYALLSRDGRIKIRGFELVRRDWSNIAKETQKKVLETILREGDINKAVSIVRDVIEELKHGRVNKEDLIMRTILRRNPSEYKSKGPEVAAAIKGIKRGVPIKEGYMISYVITKEGKSISDKADLAEYVSEGDYDADYYINHQVIPAVEKILGELGYKKDLLRTGKRQKGLGDWL